MKKIKLNLFALLLLATPMLGCSPKIYVIDNQTVLEEEAAGAWPQFEKQVLDKAKAKGPTPLSQVPPNKTRARLYNVLNGEMPVVATEASDDRGRASGAAAGAAAGDDRGHVPGASASGAVK